MSQWAASSVTPWLCRPQTRPRHRDLGVIDLSLELTQAGQTLSGHVSLDKTLVFDVAHTVGTGANTVEIGPYVNGVIEGANLALQSEKVSIVLGGRTIQRQFRLTGMTTSSDGSKVSGEYRETLWGYTTAPVTVVGTFSLQRPVFSTAIPDSGGGEGGGGGGSGSVSIYLPVIVR